MLLAGPYAKLPTLVPVQLSCFASGRWTPSMLATPQMSINDRLLAQMALQPELLAAF